MKDKKLEPIIDKLKAYKEANTFNVGTSSKIDKIIEMIGQVEPSRISIPNVNISDKDKFQMIEFFYNHYYNTNQDAIKFSEEFYFVVGEISMGMVPIKLEFLSNFIEEFVNLFPEFKFKQYDMVEYLINEDRKGNTMPF